MAKSSNHKRDTQIDDISYEVTHIEQLVQLMIPQLPADDQSLDSGLLLIDGQAKKIQSMLGDMLGGSRKESKNDDT